MVENTHSIRFFLQIFAILALLAAVVAQAGRSADLHLRLIVVFTTIELTITGDLAINRQLVKGEIELHVYELDGIQHIEAQLSKDHTADPEQYKRVVLQRFQQLQEEDRVRM